MEISLLLVLALLGLCIFFFLQDHPRSDVVALGAIFALPAFGLIELPDSLAGFSNPSVVLIALMFVIGEGLTRAGVAQQVSVLLVRYGGRNEFTLMVSIMLVVAFLGAMMSSTGTVAIFVPVVLRICARMKIDPARLMMPLAFAGLISGMLTLISASPNMVLNGALQAAGFDGFSFFAFTPIGLIVLVIAVVYLAVVQKKLGRDAPLPKTGTILRSFASFIEDYGLEDRAILFRVTGDSRVIGKTFRQIDPRANFQANIVALRRHDMRAGELAPLRGSTRFEEGDLILVDRLATSESPEKIHRELGLEVITSKTAAFKQSARHLGLVEVMLPPESDLIGHTVAQLRLGKSQGVNIIGLRRGCHSVGSDYLQKRLRTGDTLLVAGSWQAIRTLQASQHDYVILGLPVESELAAPAAHRMPYAIGALVVMIALMVSGLLPNVLAALLACLLMAASGCLTLKSAYRSVRWPVIVLVVGMMPFAKALENTGGIDYAVQGLVMVLGNAPPSILLGSLFAVTAIIALFVPNTATAVLMAPIALGLAAALEVSPHALVMTVAIACSAVFSSPLSSSKNALVLQPGRYSFADFIKIGSPLTLTVMVITALLVPRLFPLTAA